MHIILFFVCFLFSLYGCCGFGNAEKTLTTLKQLTLPIPRKCKPVCLLVIDLMDLKFCWYKTCRPRNLKVFVKSAPDVSEMKIDGSIFVTVTERYIYCAMFAGIDMIISYLEKC
jgi:hypothetical protein